MPDDVSPDTGPKPAGRLDVATLRTLAQRAVDHPLVDDWQFDPSSISPRLLCLRLDPNAYPTNVLAARLDVRWFLTDDYSVHYVESREAATEPYQCRWDRHPKTTAPRTHVHPPPDAGDAEASTLNSHHLDVLFAVLDWVSDRVEALYDKSDPSAR